MNLSTLKVLNLIHIAIFYIKYLLLANFDQNNIKNVSKLTELQNKCLNNVFILSVMISN